MIIFFTYKILIVMKGLGIILWGFFLSMLLIGIEGACWLYGTAVVGGAAYGIYKAIKQRRENP